MRPCHAERTRSAKAIVGKIEESLDVIQAGPIRASRCQPANFEVELKKAEAASPFCRVSAFGATCFLARSYCTTRNDEADEGWILAFVLVFERGKKLGEDEGWP